MITGTAANIKPSLLTRRLVRFTAVVALAAGLTVTGSRVASAQNIGVAPIAGSGPAGSAGPVTVTLSALRSANPDVASQHAPAPVTGPVAATAVPSTAIRVHSSDVRVTDRVTGRPGTPQAAFIDGSNQDIAAATDGRFVMTEAQNAFDVSTTNGTLVHSVRFTDFFCGAQPLPVCSQEQGGFDADDRIIYDTWTHHWVLSALWLDLAGTPVISEDVMAVSETADPTGAWHLYQYPPCGEFDTAGADQPHLGFNNQWIVVATACFGGGPNLAVFDSNALDSGATLNLNGNFFQFVDIQDQFALNRDNPAKTYTATPDNREYLTASGVEQLGGPPVGVFVYSYIAGPADAPRYFFGTTTVNTGIPVTDPASLDTPDCQGCLGSDASEWTHSSGVWRLPDGHIHSLATAVFGDPNYPSANLVIAVDLTDTGSARAVQISGGQAGAGALASEIALPLAGGAKDVATIGYDASSGQFYPGLKKLEWNLDTNAVTAPAVVAEGELSPTGFFLGRWVDFIDALTAIPGSPNLLIGGHVAEANPADPAHADLFQVIAP